jgi:hypothetical protein
MTHDDRPPGTVHEITRDLHARREAFLGVARAAMPVMNAAIETRNASLLREVVDVLAGVAAGEDMTERVAAIQIRDARVVRIPRVAVRAR